MTAYHQYGEKPYRLILLHSGPGATGDLQKCGHYPWNEKFAREDFYRILAAVVK